MKSNDLYGWVNSPNLSDRDRGTSGGANNLNRDLCHSSEPALFEINLRNGKWEVLVTFGDTYAHDAMYVKAEGVDHLKNINNVPNVYFNKTFEVEVTDEKLFLEFSDRGGSDVNWAVTRVMLKYVEALSLSNDIEETFTLFPNPSSYILNVEVPNSEEFELSVVDVLGRTVYFSDNEMMSLANHISINVDDWSKGIYLVNYRSGNKKITKRLIVD